MLKTNEKERVKIGIPGLDSIAHGGFLRGSNILISGGTGTGKTIFCMQFLHNGVTKYDENGVFVTLEERPKELRTEAAKLGFDFETLEEENKLIIIDAASSRASLPSMEKYAVRRGFDINTLAQEIYRATKDLGAHRIAIDSLSGLGIKFEGLLEIRTAIFKLSALLNELECTSVMTSEIPISGSWSRFGVEEFIAQGVLILFLEEEKGELRRSFVVRKMRGTSHSLKRFPFEITDHGIVVMPGGEL